MTAATEAQYRDPAAVVPNVVKVGPHGIAVSASVLAGGDVVLGLSKNAAELLAASVLGEWSLPVVDLEGVLLEALAAAGVSLAEIVGEPGPCAQTDGCTAQWTLGRMRHSDPACTS